MKKTQDLKRLILDIRKCKTAAEERKIIENEKAKIRGSISNKKSKQNEKVLNVSKLILIDMLGHDSSFAYFECIKLISFPDYQSKRIGYLGISCLCTKSPDLLMLCTSQLQKDLSSEDINIISIALITAANISDATILITIQPSIISLYFHKSNIVRYRAIAASITMVRICPETTGDVLSSINETLMESSSSIFRSTVVLFTEILKGNYGFRQQLKLYLPLICSSLSRVIHSKSPEGSGDSITAVYYLQFLSYFASDLSSDVENQLSDISKSISASTKSSIKYEIANILIRTKSSFLSRFGNNIIQSFINSPNSNLKYSGLKVCTKVADWDKQRLKISIDIEACLADPNIELRTLALALSAKMINVDNVQNMLKSYLNCLMSVDSNLHVSIVEKISDSLGLSCIEPMWHLDTVIRVCILASSVPESMIFTCIQLIKNTRDIQEYATKKLFYAITSGYRQNSLPCIAFWAVGEFPESLNPGELEKMIESLPEDQLNLTQIMYAVTMVLKVGMKVSEIRKSCVFALNHFSFYEDYEINQRASEYLVILTEFADNQFKELFNEEVMKERVVGSYYNEEGLI